MSYFALEFESANQSVLHSFEDAIQRQQFFADKGQHSFPISPVAAGMLIAKDEDLRVVLHA